MSGDKHTKVVVDRLQDFPSGERRIVEVGGRSIGVFRVGDRFYALRNRCPHQGGPLCLGRVSAWPVSAGPGQFGMKGDASLIACPWHGWEYDLASGQSFLGADEPHVRSYEAAALPGDRLLDGDEPVRFAGRAPGPYVAETFPVHVEEEYVVLEV